MVDPTRPTEQFHRYRKPDAIPHRERQQRGVRRLLEKFGGTGRRLSLGRISRFARQHPGPTLGVVAAVVIGAGLLRRR